MSPIHVQLRRRGVMVIPAELRRALSIDEGSLLLIEQRESGLFIRPAVAVPIEEYTPARRAQFILNDAYDAASYARARDIVSQMGVDPDTIPHERYDAPESSGLPGRERPVRRGNQS